MNKAKRAILELNNNAINKFSPVWQGKIESEAKTADYEEKIISRTGFRRCPNCRLLGVDFWFSKRQRVKPVVHAHLLDHLAVREQLGREWEAIWCFTIVNIWKQARATAMGKVDWAAAARKGASTIQKKKNFEGLLQKFKL